MATVLATPQVLTAALQGITLITQIVAQRQAGDITEEQALTALAAAHQGVQAAFDAFNAAPDGPRD